MPVDYNTLIALFAPHMGWDVTGAVSSPFIERGANNVPTSLPMPTAAQMKSMSTGDLYGLCHRYGYVDTPENQMQMAGKWLEKFPATTGDPERYKRAMERLKKDMRPAVLGSSRRLAERHGTLRAIDGDTQTPMMYINESSEPCEECDPLGGTEGTYAEFASNGMLPGDRCLGGSNCLCTTMRFASQ